MIHTIDGADPFLPTLAERLLDGTLWPQEAPPSGPLAIADATVYLPTRRAARALAEAFLEAGGRGAAVLPRIRALGESEAAEPGEGAQAQALAGTERAGALPVIGEVAARAALAALIPPFVSAVGDGARPGIRPFARAPGAELVRLASELLSLMEEAQTQEASFEALGALVSDADLAKHWHITTDFLTHASKAWRGYLAASGRVSRAAGRRAAADAAIAEIASARGPVIVAGSTGSVPATRDLIAAVLSSRWGRVVLPAFDTAASADEIDAIRREDDGPNHPQYGMIALLDAVGATPGDVHRLAPRREGAGGNARRAAVIGAALRPAARTGEWLSLRGAFGGRAGLSDALGAVTLVAAADEREEAQALAVSLRESVERGERAALVTPDRALARRVKHMLSRWEIRVDDSAGEPLAATPAGQLARLLAQVAAGGAAAEWLALAKHPVLAGRVDAAAVERVFRGRRLPAGTVLATLATAQGAAADFAALAQEALAPFFALGPGRARLGAIAAATRTAMERLAAEAPPLEGGVGVAAALSEIADEEGPEVAVGDFGATLDALLDGLVQRGPPPQGAVALLGPLEARLMALDHAILGGLNEGTWPAAVEPGPFMSRNMMAAFGLDRPERRLGLAAHDVATQMLRPRVTLSRAALTRGEPAVASRWWQRLLTFAGDGADEALERGRVVIDHSRALDAVTRRPPAPRPEPRPPVAVRPTRLRVTDVATLVRDPYAFYARHVLRLQPLDPLDPEAEAGERGVLIHDCLARFARDPRAKGPLAADAFADAAGAALGELSGAPDKRALWGARLAVLAPEVVKWEADRPVGRAEVAAEMDVGEAGHLRGRIDRIDVFEDASVAIIDFKTGSAPSEKAVTSLIEPQLALEAALLRAGAVPGVDAHSKIRALDYIAVGRASEPFATAPRAGKDPHELADRALGELVRLFARYRDPATGYLSRARVAFEKDLTGDYDHLSRAAEWTQ